MKKFVSSALAVTAVSALSFAGSGTEEWPTLDREIENLKSSLAQGPTSGWTVSGFIKSSYQNSSDVDGFISPNGDNNDLGGFNLDNARLQLNAETVDYSLKLQLEGSDSAGADLGPGVGDLLGVPHSPGSVTVLDAYAAWNATDMVKVQLGHFRPPFLGSSMIDENNLLFIDRSVNGEFWDFRDLGAQVGGTWEQVSWAVAAMNGGDAQGDELAISGRIAFDALGTDPSPMSEGAYGIGDEDHLTLGLGYYSDDDNTDDFTAMGFDVRYARGAFCVGLEIVDNDDGAEAATLTGSSGTPWSIYASFMLSPEQWEVAVRYEDLDDDDDTTRATAGLNYYMGGHNAKWQLNFATSDSDMDAFEIDVIALALVVGVG
ncbi:MAG TPA: porin [Planctomycetota bacterium]|nr:porin [Planctomycetota bacterium]